ncbi:sensor histidine kinase [Virgibacillus pantothenticus]|uniref:sensor histidine kinase n=1 Tax=Virgibacillus pantothenticus TaxID=1473 RepID=UPI0009855A6E|nr:HAMP domain-containing sensor histidine kinase [Virgibacillus pantothenticus]
MFNRLSLKIGVLFFGFILLIGGILYYILYIHLANGRIEEVIHNLLARGNTHSDVLEDNFTDTTMEHVGLMESESDFVVIITDADGDVLVRSDPLQPEMTEIINQTNYDAIPSDGIVVEDKWQEKRYLATDSPISIQGEHRGHVFMFAPTEQIRSILDQLGEQFKLIGVIAVAITIITILILSRFITVPLIKMKQATEQLSEGNNDVELSVERRDELGELAKSIQSLADDLDRLKNERKEFLASISHELRTPLTYIKGYADIIHRQPLPEEELKTYIGIIREEADQLSDLIKNLFELAKLDRHSFVVKKQAVHVYELIASIVDLMQPTLQKNKLTVSIQCPKDRLVFVDPNRFQQVILNILDNAVKHSPHHNSITIEVETYGDEVDIVIHNEGEGIPEKDLPFVFERLYRVEKSRSRKSGGSGLGLPIAKEIVESHGGTIKLYSQYGQGTSVFIRIPGRGTA